MCILFLWFEWTIIFKDLGWMRHCLGVYTATAHLRGVDVLLYICVSYRLLTYPAERGLAAVQVPAERVPAEWSAQGLRA